MGFQSSPILLAIDVPAAAVFLVILYDLSNSSVNSASSPPLQSTESPSLGDNSYLATPLISYPSSPGASNRSATGSPGPQNPPRNQSVTPNPPTTLPSLPRYQGAWDSLTSSPETKRAESSIYYTTAWGSPYAAPSPRRLSWSISQYAGVDRESGVSSPTSMRSGIYHGSETNQTGFLKPSGAATSARNLQSANRSPGRDPLGRKGGKSIKDFTQDWINQYLSGQPRTEKSNWLSDDSGSEAPSFFTAQNHPADDVSDDWLGLEDDTREEDLLRTPTLTDFVNRRKAAAQGESAIGRQRVKDFLHKRTETLRQEDFWGFAYDKDPQPINMADTKDAQLPSEPGNKTISPVEKPLPPPPVDDINTTLSPAEPTQGPSNPKPVKKSTSTAQRNRKKIAWRGKACIIALPLEDKRGSEESGYRLLSTADIEERLRKWEDEGYDVRGFNVSATEDATAIELGGASRPVYPVESELYQDLKDKNYGVRFPNKGEWDAYVNFLQEEKLRALGVSLGDDEGPPSVSPAASMNQMAPFPGLVSSPPIPTGSAASNPLGVPHPFSPQLNQPAPGSNGIGSLASPASQFGVQTPFLGVDQNILGGYPIQFQPTPPAQGSLTPQSFFNARQSGAASALSNTLPNMASMLSPVSPLNEQGVFHPGLQDGPGPTHDGFDDRFAHDMQGHISAGQSFRPIQTPTETPDHFHSSNVEIAHPTPRGHSRGHNLSETLQKGLDHLAQSDYHLEESIQRQLDEDDQESTRHLQNHDIMKSRWALPDNGHQHHDVHQFYGGNYQGDNGHEGSDIDTNPSLTGTPHHGPLANSISWHEPKPSAGSFVAGHRSKFSSSSFNAEAKEFDPMASFSPQNFPFQGNAFQVPGIDQSTFAFSSGSGFKPAVPQPGPYNVAAPAFTPGGTNSQNADSSGFKFSSASFNVAAPAFNPSGSVGSTASEQPADGKAKIFGDIDYSHIDKPDKKSKAIPIVRPDETEQAKTEESEAENEDSRPVPTDRHKRARRGDERSDGEAQFSISKPLGEASNVPSQASVTVHAPAEGKENAIPEKEGTLDAKPIQASEDRDGKATPVSEASTWAAPAESKEESETARPHEPAQDQAEPDTIVHKEPEAEKEPAEESAPAPPPKDENYSAKQELSRDTQKESVLSPTAQEFQFKPAVPEFVPSPAEPPKPAPAEPSKKNDLMASRYAITSPPVSPTDKPLPAEPVELEHTDVKDHAPEVTKPQSGRDSDDDMQESPDEEELNAIMEQLNDDSDVGIERLSTPHPKTQVPDSVVAPSKEKRHASADNRSEAPSPSPGRGLVAHMLNVPKLVTDFDAHSQASASPQKGFISGMHSPVRQLINENDYISDWDDVISSGEDEKLVNRSRFFDRRINDLVGSAVDERLSPLERALGAIQQTMESMAAGTGSRWQRRSTSAEIEDSDADDEDDENDEIESYRARSPMRRRDRRLEKLRNVVLEAMATREPPNQVAENPATSELVQLRESFAELHALTTQKLNQDPTENVKEMIQEILSNQMSQQNVRPSEADEIGADSLMLQIDGLKSMLRLADERAEQEYKLRREAQESMAELQGLLKATQEDAARHSEAAESAETRLLQLKEEKLPFFEKVQSQSNTVNQDNETLKITLAELSSKNISLQGTIDEHRHNSDHYKRESEQWKRESEASKEEIKSLGSTIDQMKVRLEDGMSVRQNLAEKFDRLQEEMVNVTRDITRDQAVSRRREEDQLAKFNELRSSYGREVKLREKLENDIIELEQQEREAAKLKFIFGQSQQENARLEELIANLRLENHDLTIKAARFEREFNEARESSRMEIQRTRTSFEADLEAANSQVNIVRAELEAQIIRFQSQLDNVKLDADTSQERYEMLLEEARESKASAVAAALESKELAIEDHRNLHERVLNDLRERHARALHNSSEDRARGESHLMDRLSLSEEKTKHFQDRVNHLEEKLEIAQSAARAAAEAAQNAKAGPGAPVPMHSSSPSMTFDKVSTVPEKISPQALRESILVLQDQLQQRETRIEELEQEVSSVDKDAPNKLKEKDTEINWLRELLGVRIDDLQDIIKTVSQPSFDHNSVRDAAIRLKANLQMQQQERERALSGQSFPSLPSISELTASPRALPLAAAAAWGNWRKGKDTNSNASEQTPSKSSTAGGFLSGLLTPPASNLRQASPSANSSAGPAWRRSSESRPLRSFNSNPRPLSARQGGSMPEPPSTPPLLRKSSYDHDAEPTSYEHGAFGDDNESTAGDLVSASPKDTGDGPFGPQIS